MPDTEISKLVELVSKDIQGTDPLAIADLSAVETKKVTVKSLIEKGVDILGPDSIDPDKIDWDSQSADQIDGDAIKDRSIPRVKLIANTLTAAEIAPNAIGASELANGAVDTAALKSDAVTAAKIADNQIKDNHIHSDGLGTGSIADGAITRVKMTLANNDIDGSVIADNSLTASELAPNSVGASELANSAVDTAALKNNAVTSAKIAANQIQDSHIVLGGLGTSSIANGAVTRAKMTLGNDDIDGSVIANNTLTAAEIAPNAIGASELANNAVDTAALKSNSVTDAKIADDAIRTRHVAASQIGTSELADSSVTSAKTNFAANTIDAKFLTNGSVTATQLGANSVGSSELASNSVGTVEIKADAVTSAKIADNQIGDQHITSSGLSTSSIANSAITENKLSNASVSTSKLVNKSVTADKLADGLPGSILANGEIDTNQLADDAVTTAKINDLAVTTEKLGSAAVTDAKVSNVSGAKLLGSTVTADKLSATAFSGGIELDGTVQHTNSITPGTSAGITWDDNGHVTGFGPVPSTDLPLATATTVGVISVPSGSGLTVSGAGAIDHITLVTASSVSGISYDEHGHITSTRALIGTDLPISTSTTLGAVIVPTENSNPISVNSDGDLTHAVSGITAGTYVSLNVDQYGHVLAGDVILSVDQVPNLPASKINTGQFPTARLADQSVTMPKLANYSISFIQEAQPSFDPDLHIGCLWYQPSTAQLRMYDGNVWASVGFGRLSQENLRFGGTVDASTGLVVALTDAGRNAGLEIGSELPVATNNLGGLYLVVSDPGSSIGVVPGVDFDAGDWVLCINETEGWIRIDTLSGGGGGGLIRLNDLLDVDINDPQAGDTLIFDPTTGQWTNRTTTADRVSMSPAFDGATTEFQLSMEVLDQNNVLLSVGGVIMEPGRDFVIASGTRVLNFASPPPEGSPYFLMNQQTVNATTRGGGGGTDLPPGTEANELLGWNNTLGAWGPVSTIDGGTF